MDKFQDEFQKKNNLTAPSYQWQKSHRLLDRGCRRVISAYSSLSPSFSSNPCASTHLSHGFAVIQYQSTAWQFGYLSFIRSRNLHLRPNFGLGVFARRTMASLVDTVEWGELNLIWFSPAKPYMLNSFTFLLRSTVSTCE